jgi:hypothetical protein
LKKFRFGDTRDGSMGARPTMPSETRPGKEFPGGRTLRRNLKRLSRRQNSIPKKPGYRTPGSMKK